MFFVPTISFTIFYLFIDLKNYLRITYKLITVLVYFNLNNNGI